MTHNYNMNEIEQYKQTDKTNRQGTSSQNTTSRLEPHDTKQFQPVGKSHTINTVREDKRNKWRINWFLGKDKVINKYVKNNKQINKQKKIIIKKKKLINGPKFI